MERHRHLRRAPIGETEEPDLTPLVDCVFLLLVFFMVTTVFLHTKGLDVDMPSDSQSTEEKKKDVNVLIDQQGTIQVQGADVAPADLGTRLREALTEANNDNIIINADGECPQKYVVFVVDEARAVGVEGIAFAREEEE